METTIWKFPFKIEDTVTISMPKGAQILTVQTQNENACIWAIVNPEAAHEPKYFEVFGTGHPMPEQPNYMRIYIGTFQMFAGDLVFHLFEAVKINEP